MVDLNLLTWYVVVFVNTRYICPISVKFGSYLIIMLNPLNLHNQLSSEGKRPVSMLAVVIE